MVYKFVFGSTERPIRFPKAPLVLTEGRKSPIAAVKSSRAIRVSNRLFDRIFINILNRKTDLNINLSDFELQFVRNETANVLVKTQAAMNLKELGFSPELAFAKSGVSNDPVADVANSEKYIKAKWGSQDNTKVIDESRTEEVGIV